MVCVGSARGDIALEPRLSPGTFYGKKSKSRFVAGIRLTETAYSPAFKIPKHSHDTAYFGLILQGTYTENYEAKTRDCSPSTLLFHPAGEVHSERHDDAIVRILNIEFPVAWQDRLFGHSRSLHSPACFQSGLPTRLALRFYREFHDGDELSPLAIEGLTLEILAETCRQRAAADGSQAPRWLQKVKELLCDEFTDNLSLDYIAATAGVHPAHLSRAFRQHYRSTIGEYLRYLRIERARRDLSETSVPLGDIALKLGYSDQSHFATAFKRQVGMTPGQFRKRFGKR